MTATQIRAELATVKQFLALNLENPLPYEAPSPDQLTAILIIANALEQSLPDQHSKTRHYLHLVVDLMFDTLPESDQRAEQKTNVDALELASHFFSNFAEVIRNDSAPMPIASAIRELESERE